MDIRSENPPSADGDPEPLPTADILIDYSRLEDRVPAITYVPAWQHWVYKGDLPPAVFDSLQAYLDEFPYSVRVEADRVVVTDPGFGKGKMEWVVRRFEGGIVALTETDAHNEFPECRLWLGRWRDGGWDELLGQALPELGREVFFDIGVDHEVLEDFELIGIRYELDTDSETILAIPVPNAGLECIGGRVLAEDVKPEQAEAICQAWQYFQHHPIAFALNQDMQRFERQGQIAAH